MFFHKYFQILISAFLLLVFNAAFAEITVDSLIQQIENTHKIDKKN